MGDTVGPVDDEVAVGLHRERGAVAVEAEPVATSGRGVDAIGPALEWFSRSSSPTATLGIAPRVAAAAYWRALCERFWFETAKNVHRTGSGAADDGPDVFPP